MIPVLFEIGPLKVHSFGLMLGIAFVLGSRTLAGEMQKRKLNPDLSGTITLIALVFGLLGAKLLHVIENWSEFAGDPLSIFSPSGLTWYGGFVLGIGALLFFIRRKNIPFLIFLDALGVAIMLSYGVGRIGCHLAGDGDYGVPTSLPWGTVYANGTAKPTMMLREYFESRPEERTLWQYDSLAAIPAGTDGLGYRVTQFDRVTPLHPTPLYEFLLGVLGFLTLRHISLKLASGRLFMVYLMMASLFRFSIEALRLQPKLLWGLSEAQLIAVALFVGGAVGYMLIGRAAAARP